MQSSVELVVCIASTALFDCSESDGIWRRDGQEAYKQHQRELVNVPLKPGVGFPLVQSLLALNKVVKRPLVDVVLVSRSDGESGQRIKQSISYYKLPITRMSFTCSTDVTRYLSAWKCDLFLSTVEEQVRKVLASATPRPFEGVAAGLVYHMIPDPVPVQPNSMAARNDAVISTTISTSSTFAAWPKEQVRIAFVGDDVLYSDNGLPNIQQFDREREQTSLSKGPMQAFALKLQKVREALGDSDRWRVRTFLIIAHNDDTQRVFNTLKEWGLDIDERHILDGLEMTPFLRAIDPAIFFGNSVEHIERAKQHIPAAHVPYDVQNTLTTIDVAVLATPQPIQNAVHSHININDNQ